jgi:hypothetical protein
MKLFDLSEKVVANGQHPYYFLLFISLPLITESAFAIGFQWLSGQRSCRPFHS